MMAIITQGFLKKLRVKMFSGMQDLPIRYFDTNNHGDIMSYYTNDIDTLRQLVSQSFPQITITLVTMTSVTCIMLYYSLWMTLVVVAGVAVMALADQKGGRQLRPLLPAPAGGHRRHGRLRGRDDERPEGGQGVLP